MVVTPAHPDHEPAWAIEVLGCSQCRFPRTAGHSAATYLHGEPLFPAKKYPPCPLKGKKVYKHY